RAINILDTRARLKLCENADLAQGCPAEAIARLIEALDGADRYAAREWIVATAEAEGWLDGIDADRHMVPHGDRSKVVIEPFLTDQWFVDTAKIVGPALQAVREGRTRIIPEQHEKVYFNWLENIEPWCISRQLWWGHQIPVWYGPSIGAFQTYFGSDTLRQPRPSTFLDMAFATNHLICEASADEAIAHASDKYGRLIQGRGYRVIEVKDQIEARNVLEGSLQQRELLIPIFRDPDVLDTWFSSGLWPIGTLGWPEDTAEFRRYFPTSVLVTGFDIIFFWVARMMMMQLAVVNDIPFRTVYVHALVRDEKGKKMSKSLGNVLDPLDLIDEFGADAVRFTLTSMAAMGRDLKLSSQRIAGYRNFVTKIWNACRFAEMNGVWEGHATTSAPPPATATANRWILSETARARMAFDAALGDFRFNDAANGLYAFVWGRVCDWYVEFAKPLLDYPVTAAETRAVMAHVLDQCLILAHPIMPFVTEELWQITGRRPILLAHADWPATGEEAVDAGAMAEMRWVIALIEEIRSARAEMRVPAGLTLDLVQTALEPRWQEVLGRNIALVRRLARVGEVVAGSAPKGSVTVAVEGGAFALPLKGVIDIAAEVARLGKGLAKLEGEIRGLAARLGNPRFVASAPEEVVEETREALTLAEAEAARLRAALARLGGA
ncbi:MAG: class I tRNA ligase family protein, partial [Alphaproteobacteria bacterium]|nr:class I tRNA ligase family protein [Alphaproteobacteria bacterium]